MEFDYRVFKAGNETILAISDSSILGRKFSEGELQLEVRKDFYGGSKCGEKEALRLVKSATIVNAVGKEIVSILVKGGLINSDKIITIQKTPHAQIIVMK